MALTANSSEAELLAQVDQFGPVAACLVQGNERPKGAADVAFSTGADGILTALEASQPDLVLNAITGAAGLGASEWTLRHGPVKIPTVDPILDDLWELAAKEPALTRHIENLHMNLAHANDPDWIMVAGPRVPKTHGFHGEDGYRDGCRQIRAICQVHQELYKFIGTLRPGHYKENLREILLEAALFKFDDLLGAAAYASGSHSPPKCP